MTRIDNPISNVPEIPYKEEIIDKTSYAGRDSVAHKINDKVLQEQFGGSEIGDVSDVDIVNPDQEHINNLHSSTGEDSSINEDQVHGMVL